MGAAQPSESAPVLAILACRGSDKLPEMLSALRETSVRPRHIVAVSVDSATLPSAPDLFDDVLAMPDDAEINAVIDRARTEHTSKEDPLPWLWLLRDDVVPERDCLRRLLDAAEANPDAAMLGPIGLSWDDPRLVVDAGLSLDSSGNRHTGIETSEVDPMLGGSPTLLTPDVLAVSTAGALLRRDTFEALGGFDRSAVHADIDYGWRVNCTGHRVLRVPEARTSQTPEVAEPAEQRLRGVRTFLINVTTFSFILGVPRLVQLSLLRACAMVLSRRLADAAAEMLVAFRLVSGRTGLLAARRSRCPSARCRRLLTSRRSRLRNAARDALATLVRRRVKHDVSLGLSSRAVEPESREQAPSRHRPVGGLRRLRQPIGVRADRLLLVPVSAWRVFRELLLTPAVVLPTALALFAVAIHGALAEVPRLAADLEGGRLLPVASSGQMLADYLAAWHPEAGGTASPSPPALLVLAVVGAVFGDPATLVAVLMLGGVPLAGVAAYTASRTLPASRWARSVAAAAYALLPAASVSTAQGRLDVVIAHILLPPLVSGLASVIGLTRVSGRNWLATASLTALGLAVLGAFAPLMPVLLLGLALVGFVLLPGAKRRAPRRVASVSTVVLLSTACLLPWPVMLVEHPEFLLRGPGTAMIEEAAGPWLLALSPDGSLVGSAGALIVLAAVAALLPIRRATIPGLVVAVVGGAAAVLLDTVATAPVGGGPISTSWTGGPLLLAAAGLLWISLTAPRLRRAAVPVIVVGLVVLATSASLVGREGPLRPKHDVATLKGWHLQTRPGSLPARLVPGWPEFGDDDLVPTRTAVNWLRQVDADLRSGDVQRVRSAIASAAARGVTFVTAPPEVGVLAGDLVASEALPTEPPATRAKNVFRILRPQGQIGLLGPDLARQSRVQSRPAPQASPVPVPGTLPRFTVRVSDGAAGRTLVLAAENEPGWAARIDGKPAALATAWGHQVAVPLPDRPTEVHVAFETRRPALLVVQAAAILFTVIAALPGRRVRNPR